MRSSPIGLVYCMRMRLLYWFFNLWYSCVTGFECVVMVLAIVMYLCGIFIVDILIQLGLVDMIMFVDVLMKYNRAIVSRTDTRMIKIKEYKQCAIVGWQFYNKLKQQGKHEK